MMTNAVCRTPSHEVTQLLNELGLAIGTNEISFSDLYIHHTRVPVAVTGYALISPSFARGRFPKFTFIDLIQKRPSMDETEVCALANLCGTEVTPPFWGNPEPFGVFLWEVIERYDLNLFFERVSDQSRYGSKGDHYLMRPRGFDWADPEEKEIPGALGKWREAYRKLPPVRQLMVATVLQLYMQRKDSYWMVRVPKGWNAAEGISILRSHGALADWAKLYALYPGW